MTEKITTPYGSTVWRSIKNLWDLVLSRSNFKVRNSSQISFWKDRWCEQTSLSRSFPEFFRQCQLQQATLTEQWTGHGWNFHFKRNLIDWEMTRFTDFMGNTAHINNLNEEANSLVWKLEGRGNFTVNSAYRDLNVTGVQ